MEVEYVIGLSGTLVHTLMQHKTCPSTHTPTHILYCINKIHAHVHIYDYKSNTKKDLTKKVSQEAACVGFLSRLIGHTELYECLQK